MYIWPKHKGVSVQDGRSILLISKLKNTYVVELPKPKYAGRRTVNPRQQVFGAAAILLLEQIQRLQHLSLLHFL
jgi:hypothetical protein